MAQTGTPLGQTSPRLLAGMYCFSLLKPSNLPAYLKTACVITVATLLLRLAGHHRSAGHPYIQWCRHGETGLEIGQNHETAQLRRHMPFSEHDIGGGVCVVYSKSPRTGLFRHVWVMGVLTGGKKSYGPPKLGRFGILGRFSRLSALRDCPPRPCPGPFFAP